MALHLFFNGVCCVLCCDCHSSTAESELPYLFSYPENVDDLLNPHSLKFVGRGGGLEEAFLVRLPPPPLLLPPQPVW
jgi:hypothetical protein